MPTIVELVLQEYTAEGATARKMLERVPDAKWGWKPHEKSMTLGGLAGHMGEIVGWMAPTLQVEELWLDDFKPQVFTGTRQVLDAFDRGMAEGTAALNGYADADLFKPWSMGMGGQKFFTMPRHTVLRQFVLGHLVHHRAQLGVYLRLLDIALPSTYGPSADEGQMF